MAAVVGRFVKFSLRTSPSLPRLSRCFGSIVKYQGERIESRGAVVSCQSCLRRWQSTEGVTYDERTKIRTWLDKAKNANWLSRWINDVDEIEDTMMSEEEIEEREKLIQKMTEMYFDNPSKKWDASFFEEIFNTLMKYNDRVGSEIFLEMMREMQVDVNQQLIERVETFVKKSKDASWFED
ncbi:uncharacterized protein LOC110252567 [Exaiptasia diaphana]|uniref:Uncharacterized protein n=1 Tax=Exaiptasia diaphana TaxID=2652724 RepID=A0A913Y5D4_EXADI|nr:uncharacterized protein LOC110252567 [Exaiptasia diaphana]KXJ22431.1 hypothetical protein AC249_AIPGENE27401 [Exaiptasia diaphana]